MSKRTIKFSKFASLPQDKVDALPGDTLIHFEGRDLDKLVRFLSKHPRLKDMAMDAAARRGPLDRSRVSI